MSADTSGPRPASMAKIADRIRKLLNLATSSNVNEAATAAEQAQKLMQEHKLSMADVASEDGPGITEIPVGSEGFMAMWKFWLVTAVARSFFCEVIGLRIGRRRKIRIIGKADDAQVALGVFNYVVGEIERLAGEDVKLPSVKRLIGLGSVDLRRYKDVFRQGGAAGVGAKLERQAAAFAASSERALVVSNRSQEELHSYLIAKYGESKTVDHKPVGGGAEAEAFLRGYEKGVNLNIPRGKGAEGMLDGEVAEPKAPEPAFEEDAAHGDLMAKILADMLNGDYDDDDEEGSDLTRGRGGRAR